MSKEYVTVYEILGAKLDRQEEEIARLVSRTLEAEAKLTKSLAREKAKDRMLEAWKSSAIRWNEDAKLAETEVARLKTQRDEWAGIVGSNAGEIELLKAQLATAIANQKYPHTS